MNKTFLLLKDHSCVVAKKSLLKEIIKNGDSIKYLLVPVGNDNNSYILHPIKSFMKNFTHANISFTTVIVRHSDIVYEDGDTKYTPLSCVDKCVESLDQLLQYLHSLNRMKYCNKVSNSNETYEYDIAEFIDFRIVVYGKDKVLKEIKLEGQFGPVDVLHKIKSIYNPFVETDKNLLIDEMKWKFSKSLTKKEINTIVGVPLSQTKSYQFLLGRDLVTLKSNIKDILCSSLIYDPEIDNVADDELELDCISEYLYNCGSVRYHDVWTHHINDYLEYIVYIPTIYTNLVTYAELTDFSDTKNIYSIKTLFQISLLNCPKTMTLEIISDLDNPITVQKFIAIIENINEENL